MVCGLEEVCEVKDGVCVYVCVAEGVGVPA